MDNTLNKKPGVVVGWQGALQPREVTVVYDGEEYSFLVEPDSTILDTALALGIDLPYSCQSGMCTACMGTCVSGNIKLDEEDTLADEDYEKGYTLTCVGHPLTDDVVINFDLI